MKLAFSLQQHLATAAQVREVRDMLAEVLRILSKLDLPSHAAPARTSYSVEEVAALIDRRPFTVREWCRGGRIEATKRQEKRGGVELWAISAGEVERYRNEGLKKCLHRDIEIGQ